MLDGLVRFFMYGFIFLLPWQTVQFLREVFVDGQKWEYGTIGLYVSDLFLVGIIMSYGVQWVARAPRRALAACASAAVTSSVEWLSVAFVVYVALSALWADDALLSLYSALKVLGGLLFVWVLVRYRHFSLHTGLMVLVISMLGHAVLGIGQFVLQADFASTLLGISHHNVWAGGTSVIETATGRWLRAYGGFAHPNVFGGVMAVMSVLTLGGVFACGRSLGVRRFFFGASLLFFAGLLTSFSRSAMIGFLVGSASLASLLFYISVSMRRAVFWRVSIGVGVSFLLMAVLFFVTFSSLFATRIGGESRLERLSLDERTSQIGEALRIISDHTLVGVGAGNYTAALRSRDTLARPVWVYQPVHNTPLLILAELGVLGTILVLGLVYFSTRGAIGRFIGATRARAPHAFWALTFFSGLCAFFVTSLFDHWQWDSHFGVALGFVLVGLFLASVRTLNNNGV